MSSTSVIIVSYYTGSVLFACLKSVLRQEGLHELILVDNGNPPEVLSRLQQMTLTEPRLKIITGHGNVGFAKACNTGAKMATGEFLLFLNPDCLLPPDALTDTAQALDEYPEAMLAGCWLQNPDGSEQRGGRRQLLTPKTALLDVFKLKKLNENDTPMPRDTHEVPAISGAYMCIRKQDFTRLFGFDEGYFLHVEDLDLCMRVHAMGGKIICVPKVEVAHILSTSGEVTPSAIEWHKAKGFMRYFRKHFQGKVFPGLLWLTNAAIVSRFALKLSVGNMRKLLQGKKRKKHTTASKRLMILASSLYELPESREFAGTTVLVTGATGQLGLCVVRRLLAAGASVLALTHHNAMPFRHERLRWLKGYISDPNCPLGDYYIDAVIHCTALWELPPAIDLLANADVKRIIAFGTTSIFTKASSGNGFEKGMVDRLINSEVAIAQKCAERKIDWTILRPTLIYGVGLDQNITALVKFIERYHFFPVYPPAFGKRQPVHVDDLAAAALQALPAKASFGKSYNLGGGEIITFHQMLERLFELCHRKVRIIKTTLMPFALDMIGRIIRRDHINGEIARRMNDDLAFFHDDAKRDFGYNPRSFLSGGMKDIEGF